MRQKQLADKKCPVCKQDEGNDEHCRHQLSARARCPRSYFNRMARINGETIEKVRGVAKEGYVEGSGYDPLLYIIEIIDEMEEKGADR